MTTLALSPKHRIDVVLMIVAFAVAFGPLMPALVTDWSESGDFSHGFFVPFISLWLLWNKREEFANVQTQVFWPGFALLALSVAQYLVGVAASEYYLQRTSSVMFIGGWILLMFGPQVARLCFFPVLFLLFAVPPPNLVMNAVAFPLQLQASQVTEWMLGVAGIPVVRAGNVIHLDNVSLEVARACSGLRSLVTLLALGAILVILAYA